MVQIALYRREFKQHLKKWHQRELVDDCGKDWAVSDELGNKLEVHYWCQPHEENSTVSTVGADGSVTAVEANSLPGEQCSCHTAMHGDTLIVTV